MNKTVCKIKTFYGKNKAFSFILALFLLSLIIYSAARLSPAAAEFTARYISAPLIACLGFFTGFLPFSLAELGLLLLIPLAVLAVARSFRALDRGAGLLTAMRPTLCVALAVGFLAFGCFFPCYFRKPLEENLGIKRSVPETEQLNRAALVCAERLSALTPFLTFGADGASYSSLSFGEMAKELNASYKALGKRYGFLPSYKSVPKPIALSGPLTFMHTAGIFVFITGEANVNINYPDFVIPFSMAHEMAHQRGIAREEEANFLAFLACLESDNTYIRYSGYANLYDYLRSAITDGDAYQAVTRAAGGKTAGEFAAFGAFFAKYADSTAASVSGAVNDVFLKSNGQSAGIESYDLVIELAVEWLLAN